MRRPGSAPAMTDTDHRLVVARSRTGTTAGGSWLENWLPSTTELAQLRSSHPMMDAVIDEVEGRLIRIGNHWLIDFASSNYLGFDLEPQIIDAIPGYLARWGTHPGWSRLRGSTILYEEIESELTDLLGSEDSLVLPTVTHIHTSVIPALAREGTIFVDGGARRSSSTAERARRYEMHAQSPAARVQRCASSGTTIPTSSSVSFGSRTLRRG